MNQASDNHTAGFTVLIAEDDLDDRPLLGQAFKEIGSKAKLLFVGDGEELMKYLLNANTDTARTQNPYPRLILLDLNMPKKDGRQALFEIKTNPALETIPIMVLTTSRSDEDAVLCLGAGADSFITKPPNYTDWIKIIREISEQWLQFDRPPCPCR